MATKDALWDHFSPSAKTMAAYCLGVLEHVAYTGSTLLLQRWASKLGLSYTANVQTPGHITPNLMIAGEPGRLIIAVPGTINIDQMTDNIVFAAQRTNTDFGTYRAHSFFLWCAESIVLFLQPALASFPAGTKLSFVGHSLGGAVVQLLADWAAKNTQFDVRSVITFNAPRVGDRFFSLPPYPCPHLLYYNPHDIVCELPTTFIPSTTAWQTELAFLDGYVHRDDLVPLATKTSGSTPTWFLPVTKLPWIRRAGQAFVGGAFLASQVVARAAKAGGVAGLVLLVADAHNWAQEHKMSTVLDNLSNALDMPAFPERNEMDNIVLSINQGFPIPIPTGIGRTRFVAPPWGFEPGVKPPPGPIAGLPVPVLFERFEFIESAIVWDQAPPEPGAGALISVGDDFMAAIIQGAGSSGVSPFTDPSVMPQTVPNNPHWLFRGKDRRMLLTLAEVMQAIQVRDEIAEFAGSTAAISTRDLIIDEASADAFELILDRAQALLGLFHEPS